MTYKNSVIGQIEKVTRISDSAKIVFGEWVDEIYKYESHYRENCCRWLIQNLSSIFRRTRTNFFSF